MTPDDLRQQIELQVVELIKAKMADGSMTEDRAQRISQTVLDTLKPGMSFEELFKAVSSLDDFMPELAPVVLPFMRDYENNITKKVTEQVSNLIKVGQYDAATKLAQDAIKQEIKLEWTGAGKPK